MDTPPLHAPWRMDYIRSLDKNDKNECFLCQAAAAIGAGVDRRKESLLLWHTDLTIVLMNRYPYANGHLLIAPRAHKGDWEELTDAEHADMALQSAAAVRLLKRAVSAQGFNIGANLGRVAGAGLPGHVHQHVVPRWGGDTNFMAVIGQIRVVPQAISQLYDELARAWGELAGTGK